MIYISHDIKNSNYAWEFVGFFKYRTLSDGLSLFEFVVNYDKYVADHNPRFEMALRICNFTIFEFGIYNSNHAAL